MSTDPVEPVFGPSTKNKSNSSKVYTWPVDDSAALKRNADFAMPAVHLASIKTAALAAAGLTRQSISLRKSIL
jgi:hypothetical protein